MKVRNLGEEGREPTCGCGSWLEHWENNSRHIITGTCSALGCDKPAVVGRQVKIIEADDNELLLFQASRENTCHIIPVGKECHSQPGQEYVLKDNASPVLIGETDLCGKG